MAYRRGWVNRRRLVDRLVRLCATDSVSRREGALAALVQVELAALGCAIHSDGAAAAIGGECGNLLARLPGTRPGEAVLFLAHLDRCAGGSGVRPRLAGEVLVSSGNTVLGADDAAGLAVALEVVATLVERQLPHAPVELACTIGEELGMLGAQALEMDWFTARLAYCLDGEGPVGTAYTTAPHQLRLALHLDGRDRHAPARSGEPGSALQIAGYALAHMRLGRIDPLTVVQAGVVGVEATPGQAELWVEVRSAEAERLATQSERIRTVFEAAAARFSGACTWLGEQRVLGYRLEATAPVLRRAQAAMSLAGIAPVLGAAPGASDANVLIARGIPTLLLGMGFEQIHTTAECMPVAQLVTAAEMALAIALE